MQSKHQLKIQFKHQVGEEGIMRLKRVVQQKVGTVPENSEDAVNFGYTIPANVREALFEIMDWWVDEIDQRIDAYIRRYGETFSEDYIALMQYRGITYPEYLLFCEGAVDPEDYEHHRSFEFLLITDAIHRQQYISRLERNEENDFQKYCALLLEYQVPPSTFFLTAKVPLYYSAKATKKGVYIVGQSGTGKSETLKLFIYDTIRKTRKSTKTSLFILEPHGDLCQEVARYIPFLSQQRGRLIYLNPTIHKLLGCTTRYTPIINFFDIPSKDEETIDAFSQEITNAISQMIAKAGSSDDVFSTNMDTFLKPCIATLLRLEYSDLSMLKRFMSDNNEDLIALGQQSPNPEHAEFFRNGFQNKRYKATRDAVYIKLQSLLNSSLFRRLVIGKSTIDLERALNEEGKVVILDFQKGRGRKTATDFGKLMVAYVQAIALRRQDIPKHSRPHTYICIDEFQNYIGGGGTFAEIASESRKYGASMVLSHQVVGMKMSSDLTNILMSNCTIKIVGKNAKKSLEVMAANIDLPVTRLMKIPKYQFYVHNKDSEYPAVLMKVPDFLVHSPHKHNPFYMTEKQFK